MQGTNRDLALLQQTLCLSWREALVSQQQRHVLCMQSRHVLCMQKGVFCVCRTNFFSKIYQIVNKYEFGSKFNQILILANSSSNRLNRLFLMVLRSQTPQDKNEK